MVSDMDIKEGAVTRGKHTPGSWLMLAWPDKTLVQVVAGVGVDSKEIAMVQRKQGGELVTSEEIANARLIASSPRLLAVAREVYDEARNYADGAEDASERDRFAARIAGMLNDVIAMAEGRLG